MSYGCYLTLYLLFLTSLSFQLGNGSSRGSMGERGASGWENAQGTGLQIGDPPRLPPRIYTPTTLNVP